MKRKLRTQLVSLVLILCISIAGIYLIKRDRRFIQNENNPPIGNEADIMNTEETELEIIPDEVSYINSDGITLESRILAPDGYERVEASHDTILTYLRNLELKPDGAPVLLHDGREKGNQTAQAAVFALDVGEGDLQQCADSIIRIYAEYFWAIGAYDKIQFHLTNGFLMDYITWRDGKRIKVDGNNVSWVTTADYDESYETFRSYLKYVMIYAGTHSLSAESKVINQEELEVGDIIIKGGSPGHCVLVVDVASDQEGNRVYLLAQGYMPAQEFHVLNKPGDSENPWYSKEDLEYPIRTPEYTFGEGSVKRWLPEL